MTPQNFSLLFAWGSATLSKATWATWDWEKNPVNLLVSFVYLDAYRQAAEEYQYRPARTMLDSGAFSAWNSGKVIDFEALMSEIATGGWDEAVALDVVGQAEASLKNALIMKERGLKVIPVFHIGEPWEFLAKYCEEFERVGLSCRFGETITESFQWLRECFRLEWPHKFHSFGWVAEPMLMEFPFDTADSASWSVATGAFGKWKSLPNVPGPREPCTREVEIHCYRAIEERVRLRWQGEWKYADLKKKGLIVPKWSRDRALPTVVDPAQGMLL